MDKVISHYRILNKLGVGGMGEVYLAEDTTLGRRVALKLLPQEYTQNAERLRRFKQEARSASALNHPNIVTIHEVGESDGQQYIATEFIDGETLRARLRRTGAVGAREALDMAVQLASAFSAAHEAGIVHRDIKPENIMVRRDGYVKVLDFGLAKLTETVVTAPADMNEPTVTHTALTEAGVVLGTAPYMSPEQTIGNLVDARSDIFSFGAVLYEMISGRRAFAGASAIEISAAVINQDPARLPGTVSPDLDKLITRCLRKDPARRFQTMADLKALLEDLREESSVSRRRLGALAPRHWRWIAWSSAIVFVALAVYAWQSQRPAQDIQPLQAVTLTTLPGVEQSPSFSPDGSYVVFAWTDPKQGNQDIYVQLIGSGSPLRLTADPLADYNPVWSPDGRSVAFLRGQPPAPTGVRSRELRLMPPLGGPDRKLADIRAQDFPGSTPSITSTYLAWSADSSSLVVTDSPGEGQPDALFVVSLETGDKRRLTSPQPPVLADTSPAISPDGRSLVFLRRTSWGSGELHLLPLTDDLTAAGESRRLTLADLRAEYPAWTPDGAEIVFSAKGGLWRISVTGDTAPTRIAYVGEDGSMATISRAQPGKPARLVYVRSFADANLWRIDFPAPGAAASSPPVMTMSSTKPEYHAQFSPDGSRVAFASIRSGDPEIWTADLDGSNVSKLTSMGARETMCPRWSPDGQLVAFSSNPEGEFDVYVIPAAGGKPRRLTSHPAIDICPAFSRDGNWIYFSSTRSGDYRIWKMPATGGDAARISPNQGSGGPIESLDRASLYYNTVSVVSSLWRMPTAGGEPVKVIDGIVWFNWALLENGVYYIDRLDGDARVQYFDFTSKKSATVARNLGEVTAGLTASPNGRTILFARADASADDLMLVENFR